MFSSGELGIICQRVPQSPSPACLHSSHLPADPTAPPQPHLIFLLPARSTLATPLDWFLLLYWSSPGPRLLSPGIVSQGNHLHTALASGFASQKVQDTCSVFVVPKLTSCSPKGTDPVALVEPPGAMTPRAGQ